ncbi:DUF4433 domain-containing protein [Oceanidesulfovibrio indonesiensis]|uniref:DUF4433 domain-containing protein n=2 Tax=Oceanidesulfovibrio indonesiensis TaxID=54767 RepID=A0A7M3MJM7_9BACT|nr:DUF4433 domain-containing protein [Oceanidesulfovibrio indonesiensis]
MSTSFNAKKALIWRIVHRDNLPWLLQNGLHCSNSKVLAPEYTTIGNPELIEKRRHRVVPIGPKGTLADYVPFYFTPFSVMMYNIHTGRGVERRHNKEIIILVSSLYRINELGIAFVYTSAHAYLSWTEYFDDLDDLDVIDWGLLQRRDFRRDDNDPQKLERYQAEALIHRHMPVDGLLGIICYTDEVKESINVTIGNLGLELPVYVRTRWYF